MVASSHSRTQTATAYTATELGVRPKKKRVSQEVVVLSTELSWDTPSLLSFSERTLSPELQSSLAESIDSIRKRQFICNYHRDEFKAAYYDALPEDTDILKVFIYMMSDGENNKEKDVRLWLGCYANAIGYIQSAHAVLDITSHVIYYAHGGEHGAAFKGMKTKNVSIHSINKKLTSNNLYPDLAKSIGNLLSMDEFVYLNDLANLVKHRNLVPIQHTSDQAVLSGLAHGMIFKSFEKDGRVYKENEILSFFENTHKPIFTVVVDIGRHLNATLGLKP